VGFREALSRGLAPDGGLYMPDSIPTLSPQNWNEFKGKDIRTIGKIMLRPWLGEFFSGDDFDQLVEDALNFDAPLVQLKENLYVLELFHGPTLAFKDFAARTMGRLMAALLRDENRELHVLTATSGDTGAAVADGFYDVPGIRVWVLYPSGKVSPLQEKQFTTLGKNITAIEVDGTFDDCQRLVKQAFVDEDLNRKMKLTSANSINIGRLLPQMVYYARAWAQLKDDAPPLFSVPSGNFGNLTAGLLAQKMGLPAAGFIAGVNSNRTFFDYIQSGTYEPRKSERTISNAMDVGDPSNFERILALYGGQINELRKYIHPYWFSDDETTAGMHEVNDTYGYVMDPHTAVGYLALKKMRRETGDKRTGIVLATAHPAKFLEVIPEEMHQHIEMPDALSKLKDRAKKSVTVSADYDAFREIVLAGR